MAPPVRVAPLMRAIGLKSLVLGRPVETTISHTAPPSPPDRVNGQVQAPDEV